MRIAFVAVILVFSFLIFVPQVSASQDIIQVYIVWHRQYPMWLATYQICPNVYIQASGGIMHTIPAYQLHVNNTIYDITRYRGNLYIEIVPTSNGYILYPFNVTVQCSRFRFHAGGDIWLHIERNVTDGQLIDHKLYNNNGLRLIPYPHTFEYRVDVLGRINTGASTTRYTSNVMYHFIVRTDSGTVIDRVVDSGVYNFTLDHAPSYIEAYTYAVINNTNDDASNGSNSGGSVAKASPIDFSSIYNALSGNRSLPIVLVIIGVLAIVGVFALARR